jgi:hypothetical protein
MSSGLIVSFSVGLICRNSAALFSTPRHHQGGKQAVANLSSLHGEMGSVTWPKGSTDWCWQN